MKRTPQSDRGEDRSPETSTSAKSVPSRRKFLGKIGTGAAATVAASVLGAPAALAETASGFRSAAPPTNPRIGQATTLRINNANRDAGNGTPPHTTNGDEGRYPDKSASYSKGLLQDDIGVVNPAAWASFKKALKSGQAADWNAIIQGGPRTQNGPQGSYAYDLEGLDSSQYGDAPGQGDPFGFHVVPPFDQINSAEYGAQLAEMYWSSLIYDVAFTDYATNPIAQAAAAELSVLPGYRGPRDSSGHVTPDLLFRGTFPGDTIGPYMSQFMITPCSFGSQPLDMLFNHFVPGVDYMTDPTTYQLVQNGQPTGLSLAFDPIRRYLHNARGLAAYTHVDVLYQGYFTALLAMSALGVPVNPGNPYAGNTTQNGFCTFGGPDFAASQGECAAKALQKVWYQKWLIHLTQRPEAGGAVLRQILSGNQSKIDAHLNSNILNSQAPQMVFSKYGDYFLPQPFPEGSPTHPSYPTGHGTVAGACVTFLKFFFDENHVIANPQMPSSDGLSLVPYTGGDAGQITVGGELNKLAHNVSYGHGILAGIHWRTDTDWSMTLGEAMAISMLKDRAACYNEKFSITFTKFDGNKVTISNH